MSGYGYWLAPIAACMFVDYYLIKRGNLRLHDLFDGSPASRYWFTRGVNYRTVVSVVLSLIPCLPSFAAQIAPSHLGFTGTAYNFFYISFVFTYILAGLLYYCSYLLFPEKSAKAAEDRTLGWEQLADENDEEERAQETLGLAEEGSPRGSTPVDGGEKKLAMETAVEI